MQGPCDITVIVPCRNESRHIATTIARLKSQVGVSDIFSYEVLFVDGCSDDGTLQVLQKQTAAWSNAHVLSNERKITPVAFNIGIRRAVGRYIAILGAHVEIADDYLLKCLETIRESGADNVGGPWRAKGHGYVGRAVALAFQSPISVGGARSHDLRFEGPLDSVWGGFYDRGVFDRIGLFDESLVRNQDDELNYRLTNAGGVVWQSPAIRYAYVCRDSIGLLFKQYFEYGYWKVRVIQKHKVPASWRHVVPGVFVITVAALGVSSLFTHATRPGLLGIVALYAAVIVGTSIWIGLAHRTWSSVAILPLVLTTFHVAYGLGFVKGIWDFVVWRKHRKGKVPDGDLSR